MRRHTQLLTRGILALIFAAVAVVPTAGSVSASELHIVQPGETLSQIAKQYQTTVADLQQRNGLPDANSIRSGQRLLIDAGETVAPEPQSVERFQLYTVQPGDTLFLLAGKHGISLARLMAINGFSSEEWLSVGQELLVPRALAPAPQLSHPVSALQPFPPIAGMQPGRTRPAVHTVQPGERLSDIAQRYGVNPAALARLNDLHNNSAPEPGRALRIPSANALELLEGMNLRLDRAHYPARTGIRQARPKRAAPALPDHAMPVLLFSGESVPF